MPLAPEIVESVAAENTKVGAGAPAFYQALAMRSAVAEADAMGQIRIAATAKAVEMILGQGPAEAAAAVKTLTGSDVAQLLSNLGAAIEKSQIGAKVAQTTPPPTA